MEQLAPLLEKLAEKLGTTVEHLWQVLINQAQVQLQINELWMTFQFWAMIALGVFFLLALVGIIFSDDYEEKGIFGWLSFAIFVVAAIFAACYFGNYTENITLTTNPEYWALKEVLSQLK